MGERVYPVHRVEIDISSVAAFRAELVVLVGTTDSDLVLDCQGLEFVDSSAVAAFVHTRVMLDRLGRRLGVVNLTGMARRAFELLGLEDLGIADLDQAAP